MVLLGRPLPVQRCRLVGNQEHYSAELPFLHKLQLKPTGSPSHVSESEV